MHHYSNPLLVIIALLLLPFWCAAQKQTANYVEIRKEQYDQCKDLQHLFLNTQIKKQPGKLAIPQSGRTPKIFKDDTANQNYRVYEYVGDIKETKLSLIKRTGYNSEAFYLFSHLTGKIDTLIGSPVFAQNKRGFACINNPGTDELQQVQVGEIKDGQVNTTSLLKGKAGTFFESISCVGGSNLLIKDNTGKYWKLTFKVGDQ